MVMHYNDIFFCSVASEKMVVELYGIISLCFEYSVPWRHSRENRARTIRTTRICRDAEHENWTALTTPPASLLHQLSCHTVSLLL